jgi:hypothetical protein
MRSNVHHSTEPTTRNQPTASVDDVASISRDLAAIAHALGRARVPGETSEQTSALADASAAVARASMLLDNAFPQGRGGV